MNWSIIILFLAPFMGGLIAHLSGYKNEKILNLFIAFAGGYIFSTIILHVLPEIFQTQESNISLVLLAGFFFQVFITRITEGAEHGHLHNHHHNHTMALPLGLFLSMCLHAFTEGIPLGLMNNQGELATTLSIGIALHEMPAAFALVSILQTEKIQKITLWGLTLAYALMVPLGSLTSSFFSAFIPEYLFLKLLAFVAGILLYISTTILFENSTNHQFSEKKLIAILGGVLVAILLGLWLH